MRYLTQYESVLLPLAVVAHKNNLTKEQMHEWVETMYKLRPTGKVAYYAIEALKGLEETRLEIEEEMAQNTALLHSSSGEDEWIDKAELKRTKQLDIELKEEYSYLQYLMNQLEEVNHVGS